MAERRETTTLKKEAQEVAEMIKAATSSLMPSPQSRDPVGRSAKVDSARKMDEQIRQENGVRSQPTTSDRPENNETGENFRASVESFFRSILGSCGGVLEAASFLVKNSWKPSDESSTKDRRMSRTVDVSNGRSHNYWVSDDKRRRSMFHNARANSTGFPLQQEMPPPVRAGADGEHCLDISQNFDDNISALSAHTLEEMARHNSSFRNGQVAVPPPITPASSSSGSSKGEDHKLLDHSVAVPDAYFIKKSRRVSKRVKVRQDSGEDFGEVKFLPPRTPKRYLEV